MKLGNNRGKNKTEISGTEKPVLNWCVYVCVYAFVCISVCASEAWGQETSMEIINKGSDCWCVSSMVIIRAEGS